MVVKVVEAVEEFAVEKVVKLVNMIYDAGNVLE